ncbi:hypothetical protein K490DRAFT_70055 [Saccharata proteae CBS 121410]|uniref:MYND-type domain-containing protein n=1 Tax=Saccharata proteae CBS 121410 TaxID=1314787 RepID=A0A9P4LSX8_9PEZI|nr:hypothetical protein K490DRAFT_70055 [Saccharata proteae CBS 121410]
MSTPTPSQTPTSAATASSTTRSIPFHFLVSSNPPRKLTHHRDVPTSLLVPEPDPTLFVETLTDALAESYEECKDAAPKSCEVCARVADRVIQTPVSFLHVDEPAANEAGRSDAQAEAQALDHGLGKRVELILTPVCASTECAELARQRVRRVVEGMQEPQEPKEGPKDMRCRSCGKSGETMKRCTGCGRVRYCGRECQRRDWKRHRRECGVV